MGVPDPVPLTTEEAKTLAVSLREQAVDAERKGQLLLAHQKRQEAAYVERKRG